MRISILAMLFVVVGCSGAAPQDVEGAPPADDGVAPPTFTLLGPDPAAASTGGGDGLGYVPAPVTVPQPSVTWTTTDFPAAYDLRSTGKVTSVKNQGSCGACWAFATFASSESALLPVSTWDFSEQVLNNAHGFDIAACNGGNAWMSIAMLSRWGGPCAEADAPYTATAQTFTTLPAAKKHLAEALVFPNRTGPLDNTGIKTAVTTYGGMYTTMFWSSSYWKSATSAYYDPTSGGANHAVTVVGWDDAYPRANFTTAPAGDGAFLIKNSWGTGFGSAGYFWISYYDAVVGKENVAFRQLDDVATYDAIYQYDKLGQTTALSVSALQTWSGAVYTAQADGNLAAAAFYTTAPGVAATVSVYDAPTGAPSSGTLIGSANSSHAWAGYHTVSLASVAHRLTKGRKFGLVVSVTAPAKPSYIALEAPFSGYSSKVVATNGTTFVSYDGKTWTDAASTWKANVPLKAFTAPGPNCDDQNACTTDTWDGTACVHTAVAQGTVCRAAAGPCDVAEVCDGSGAACPADGFVTGGTVCRAAAGDCDAAEACTGSSAACPADTFKPMVTVCRAAKGACDVAETCTGKTAACPADVLVAKGVVCRAKAGACDVAESCSGTSVDCPADKVAASGTVCRAAAGSCDVAEVCNGTGTACPADVLLSQGTVCRPAAGACDVAETCSGASAACPTNTFVAAGTVCRAAAGACDVAETCTGSTASCPKDALRPKGYVCSTSPTVLCSGTKTTCP